jgi:hypothetical protein
VKASNSCVRTLIFDSFLLLPFVKFFHCPFFTFLIYHFIVFSSIFDLVFYRPLFFPSFSLLFCANVVSSLAYSKLLENKKAWLLVGC